MKVHELIGVRSILAAVVWAVGMVATPAGALAAPIDVTYTVTPEFNDFLLNFSVTNNVGADIKISAFGVNISSGQDIPSFGVPPGWADAGPGVPYNNNWMTDPDGPFVITFGQTLSGFIARDSDSATSPIVVLLTLAAPAELTIGPSTIDWIALTIDGAGNRGSITGTASNVTTIPEPGALMLLCAGLGMLGIARLRRFGRSNRGGRTRSDGQRRARHREHRDGRGCTDVNVLTEFYASQAQLDFAKTRP